MVVVVVSSQRSVEHRQRSVSSLPLQLFPLTFVKPSQKLHYRKQRAPDAVLQEMHPCLRFQHASAEAILLGYEIPQRERAIRVAESVL